MLKLTIERMQIYEILLLSLFDLPIVLEKANIVKTVLHARLGIGTFGIHGFKTAEDRWNNPYSPLIASSF